MKKIYAPLNMIKNGRYAVLYEKLSPELQQEVLTGWRLLRLLLCPSPQRRGLGAHQKQVSNDLETLSGWRWVV